MITEGADGRIFEVTAEGEIVWEFISPYFGEERTDHNMVYRAYRVPYDWIPQLERPDEQAVVPPALEYSQTFSNVTGQIIGQHHPHIIPVGLPGAGNLLVFDNGGQSGYGYANPAAPIVGPHAPYDGTGSVDDRDDIGPANTQHNVGRVESLIATVIPLVRPHIRRGVDVQPVEALSFFVEAARPIDHVTRLLRQAELELEHRKEAKHRSKGKRKFKLGGA